MTVCKCHFSSRIDKRLFDAINNEAKRLKKPKTAIIERMAIEYFGASLPGMCPKCKTMNSEKSKFCSECGNELIE